MTNFIGTPQDDTFSLTSGKDWVEIKPDGGHDAIANFEPGTDLLVFNGFGFMSPDPISPFITIDPENATVSLDLSAARGLQPGLQTVLLTGTAEFGPDDMVFNIGVLPPQSDHLNPADDTHGIGLPPKPENTDFLQEKVVHDFDHLFPPAADPISPAHEVASQNLSGWDFF
jgi:hypothetical protein